MLFHGWLLKAKRSSQATSLLTPPHGRGCGGAPLAEVKKIIIWGNHSATQYPDLHHATVAGKPRWRT